MTAPKQVRIVHPVCTRECRHNLPVPPRVEESVPIVWGPPPVVTDRCGACGYDRSTHDLDGKCHLSTADKNGRRGRFRAPPPVDPSDYRTIMRRDAEQRAADHAAANATYEPVVVPPPRVPARPPTGPGELAGYQGRQAVGLGRKAVAAGWQVNASYWQAHDGTEGCAVRMARGDLYAVACWSRKPGKQGSKTGWEGGIAYGVRRGDAPVKLTHTQLEGVITT